MSAKFLATVYNFFLHLVSRPSLQQNERERWKQGLYKGKWLGIHYGTEQGIRFIITSHYDARYTEGNDNYSCVPLNGKNKRSFPEFIFLLQVLPNQNNQENNCFPFEASPYQWQGIPLRFQRDEVDWLSEVFAGFGLFQVTSNSHFSSTVDDSCCCHVNGLISQIGV